MRWTQTLIPTLREDPKDAEADSHKLMLRAGYIRKLSSGVYSYLPLGARVLEKVSAIIREEMVAAGADYLLMPALHPAELWKATGRYEALGEDKLAFKNRTGQEFVLGPTHEEVVTELVGAYTKSYKDLPKTVFQIQTKFRDELRPRFGIIRTKEFIMKDAYSFDRDEAGLDASYQKMYEAYKRIFSRCGLAFVIVSADPGLMGGKVSQEFMVKSQFGEDVIIQCPQCGYTASRDIASRAKPALSPEPPGQGAVIEFDTPGARTIEELKTKFGLKPRRLIKTILYMADGKPLACLVRGDTEVNEAKVRKLTGADKLVQATAEEIQAHTGGPLGFTGPVGLKGVRMVADYDIEAMRDSVTGANKLDRHVKNVNIVRDFQPDLTGDIRYADAGDSCPECGQALAKAQAMEIGHVFKLGTRYTQALEVTYLDEKGAAQPVIMGCYGIGVNRILAAHVDEHHDPKGIIWQKAVAPYQAILITVNHSDAASREFAEKLYREMTEAGVEILYDDRDERAGVKFNDADLIGIPVQIIVGEKNLKEGKAEIVKRQGKASVKVDRDSVLSEFRKVWQEVS